MKGKKVWLIAVGIILLLVLLVGLFMVGVSHHYLGRANAPEPTTQLTAMATLPAPVPTATTMVAPTPETAMCPTEAEFEALAGVTADVVGTEACAFHWRGDPLSITVQKPCLEGWICTIGSQGENFVFVGDNNLPAMQIFAATWRKVDMFPPGDAVHEPCTFLRKVQHEGEISDPQWTATAGNFSCP